MICSIFMNFLSVKFIISSCADQISVGFFFIIQIFKSNFKELKKKNFFYNVLNIKNNLLFT